MELKVGDVLIRYWRSEPSNREEVVRVTKTLAITDSNTRFKREQYDVKNIHRVNRQRYSFDSYSLQTPGLKKEYEAFMKRKSLKAEVGAVKFESLSNNQLEEILKIVKTEKQS